MLRRKQKTEPEAVEASVQVGPYGPDWDVPARFNFTRDVVEARASSHGRTALTFAGSDGIVDRRSFTEIARDAARWAHLLRARLDRGDRVIILLGRVPAWHGAMLGALKGGLVAVPCSEMLRAKDLAFRVRHSGARLVIADRSSEAEVEEMLQQVDSTVAVLYLDEALSELSGYLGRAPTEDTAATDNALILYTSGTTKEPKGVVHTHAYTWAMRAQAEYWLDLQEQDVVWCTAGTGWAKSVWNVLLGPWAHGAEIVLHDGVFDPEERLALIQKLGVTVLCQAPTEYRMLAKLDTLDDVYLPHLRHAVSAGEPLNPEVIERFQSTLDLTVYDGYGQTENSLLVANTPAREVRPGSMGFPTPGHEVAVVDDHGHVCPPGAEGDLVLIGRPPTLFTGYWNAPDETEAVFRGGRYVTGDRAVRDEEGYLWFVGRADDVILSSAYRIGPFEVESALLEHPAVAESAVVGVPDADRGQIVKAFVVLRSGQEAGHDLVHELQEHVKTVTAPYKYPRAIAFVDELPKTASGKIRRSELRLVPHVELPKLLRVAAPIESDSEDSGTSVGTPPSPPPPIQLLREPTSVPSDAGHANPAVEAAQPDAEGAAQREAEEAARREAEAAAVASREAEEAAQREAEAAAQREAEAAAQREAEEAALRDAEAVAQLEAEETARREAEDAARREAEAAALREAEETARREAEAQAAAQREAEAAAAAQRDAEEGARRESEEAARHAAEAAALREAEEAARREAEETARREAEAQAAAQREAEEAARHAAEAAALRQAEEAARREAEETARREAEAQAAAQREAEEAARHAAEAAALRQAEEAARREAEETARREAEAQAAAQREAEEAARREAEAAAQRDAEEAARREAEDAARHAAEAAALREAEEAARREADETARREAEAQAAAQREAEAEAQPQRNAKPKRPRDGRPKP